MKKLGMNSELKQCITDINDAFRKKRTPSDSLKRSLSTYCQKKYLFDMIYLFHSLRPVQSSYTVEAIMKEYSKEKEKLGWLFLCSAKRHRKNPRRWKIDGYDIHLYHIGIEFLNSLNLSSKDFKDIAEYHLREGVDNCLNSNFTYGIEFDYLEEDEEEEYYERLLNKYNDFEPKKKYYLNEHVKYYASSVGKLFKKYNLNTLKLLNYGNEFYKYQKANEIETAKYNLIGWLYRQNIDPYLFDLTLNKFFIPKDGVLIPKYLKMKKNLEKTKFNFKSVLEIDDLEFPLKMLVGLCEGKKNSNSDIFLRLYFEWHSQNHLEKQLKTELFKIKSKYEI